jgi:hypothetical protein
MPGMISIDFGNSFTKVGVRRDNNTPSELVRDNNLDQDDGLNVCIPSLVARVERRGEKRWRYGLDVLKLGQRTSGTHIYRNWKPLFFENIDSATSPPVPANRQRVGVAGSSLRTISRRSVEHSASLVGLSFAEMAEILRQRGKFVDEDGEAAVPSSASQEGELTKEFLQPVAIGFFKWLRNFINPICRKMGLEDPDAIPVRICVPSFGSQAKAEELLTEVLQDSGWQLDEGFPVLTEPLANSLGIVTEGRNATWFPQKTRRECRYNRTMFGDSELFQAIRGHLLQNTQKFYWVMGIDVGGYTADFSMLGFDLGEFDASLDGYHDGMRREARQSKPIGVRLLDTRIAALLSEAKQAYLDEMNRDPDQRQIETFHRTLYDNRRVFNTTAGAIGEGSEGEAIESCILAFANEIADSAERFLTAEQYKRIDALILTGGGCNIPMVRRRLCQRLERYRTGSSFAATYVPAKESERLPGGYSRLGPRLVRGATALGGASVFFDFART